MNAEQRALILILRNQVRIADMLAKIGWQPACQHDLQQSAPTVRVWHSIFEPEKQSAECNVCGSRWTLNGVGRG